MDVTKSGYYCWSLIFRPRGLSDGNGARMAGGSYRPTGLGDCIRGWSFIKASMSLKFESLSNSAPSFEPPAIPLKS